jgi:hypothetical protein
LLRQPERWHALGACGRQRVRKLFLIPRLVLTELQMIDRLLGVSPADDPVDDAGVVRRADWREDSR